MQPALFGLDRTTSKVPRTVWNGRRGTTSQRSRTPAGITTGGRGSLGDQPRDEDVRVDDEQDHRGGLRRGVLLLGAPSFPLGSTKRGDLLRIDATVAGPHLVDHLGPKEHPQGVLYDRVRSAPSRRSSASGALNELCVDLHGNHARRDASMIPLPAGRTTPARCCTHTGNVLMQFPTVTGEQTSPGQLDHQKPIVGSFERYPEQRMSTSTNAFGPSALLTPANGVTLARLLASAPFAALVAVNGPSWPALALWAILALTDGLDGWVARRQGVTRSGAFLDPLADKLLVLGAMSALVALRELWWVPVALIAIREAAMSAYRSFIARHGVSVPARNLAKLKTLVQYLAVSLGLAPGLAHDHRAVSATAWTAAALTLVSGAQYLRDARRQSHAGRPQRAARRHHPGEDHIKR